MIKRILLLSFSCAVMYGCQNKPTPEPKTVAGNDPALIYGKDSSSSAIEMTKESMMTSLTTPEIAEEKNVKPKATEVEVTKRVPLTIVVQSLASEVAPIEMSVYSPDDNFLSPKSNAKKYRWRPKKGKAVTKIDNLPYGDFAIALYQDVNDNGKIDKNMIGIPEEPFAFSNDYKPVIKAPSFNDCKFSYSPEQNTITITLQN